MHITNISEAKANLSRLLQDVMRGKQVIIGKAGTPIAVLSPYIPDNSPRKLGGNWKGQVKIADDFDRTPQELIDAFHASALFPEKDG